MVEPLELELGPRIEPAPLGDAVEPLGELLPDELPGPQSFIAVVPLLLLSAMPLVLELGLLVEPAPALLEPGLLAAALLPGGQSLLDMLCEVPDVEPLVPALVPDLPPVAPVVLLVCAIAALPSVSAMIEAAVRRRRFIRCPPCECCAPPGGRPWRRLIANRGLRRRVPIYPESGLLVLRTPRRWAPALGPAGPRARKGKEKGPHRSAAQVQGGKARRTCSALRRTGSHRTIRIGCRLSING
ncbi:MAG TPA: hypothetical protein VJO12_16290 [Stellaceae bacterium]|nr:hypothetical protein [Stellaceae bacterium]